MEVGVFGERVAFCHYKTVLLSNWYKSMKLSISPVIEFPVDVWVNKSQHCLLSGLVCFSEV